MANEEHLAILKQGVKAWNPWREEHSTVRADLSNADLSYAKLSGADLSNAKLNRANLSGADLSGADLSGADLSGADLKRANLRGYLSRADLRGAYLNYAILSNADLSNADLSYADLSYAKLKRANLRGADLKRANLRGADLKRANLRGADLKRANLSGAKLSDADLRGADLSDADLRGADLSDAKLSVADLSVADLSVADLSVAYLNYAILSNADLSYADLSVAYLNYAILSNADLTGTNLHAARVLNANFSGATLTGACIADWQMGSSTTLANVRCDYIFRTFNPETNEFSGRLPVNPSSTFAPGEFEQWVKVRESSLETIDITFTEGIDWQAFFQSFQELRSQYGDEDLSIQAIERKTNKAFVIRLEVSPDSDKAAIESRAKELYTVKRQELEAQYTQQLRLQGAHLEDARRTIEVERQKNSQLIKIAETMAKNQQEPKYDMRGAQFGGGFAETVRGDQIGGTINNNGAKLEDIQRLITTLREQAQAFPVEQKDEAIDVLDALGMEIEKPQPDQNRIGRYLKRFFVIVTTVGTLAGGVATFSGDLKDIKDNTIELVETLGIPVESVQPEQIPPADAP